MKTFSILHERLSSNFILRISELSGNGFNSIVLVKLDSAGNVQYTNTIELQGNDSFIVSNNPATTSFTISTSAFQNDNNLIFRLFDLNGRIILQQAYNAADAIDVSQLNNGIYFGEVSSKTKTVRGKVMVQH